MKRKAMSLTPIVGNVRPNAEIHWKDKLTHQFLITCSCGWETEWEDSEEEAEFSLKTHREEKRLDAQHTPLMPQGDK